MNKVARDNLEDSKLLDSESSLGGALEKPVRGPQISLPNGDEGRGSGLALISLGTVLFLLACPMSGLPN